MKQYKLNITEAAIKYIESIFLPHKGKLKILRIICVFDMGEGFSYSIECEDTPTFYDIKFNYNDIMIVVNNQSMTYMYGSTIYYVNTDTEKGLRISNPYSWRAI